MTRSTSSKRRLGLVAVLCATGLAVSGCGLSFGSGGGSGGSSGSGGKLTVLAASSLSIPFEQLETAYEKKYGTTVKLVLDSSATLVEQLKQGAPGGILATADQTTMHQAQSEGLVQGTPVEFATNTLVLAVPSNNPAHITSFADLNKPGVKYLTCVPTAPCGQYAASMIKADKITAKPVSQETDDASVVAKIASGQADAGLVYMSDVTSSGSQLKALPIPGAAAQKNPYFISVTTNVKHLQDAQNWITLLQGPVGKKIMKSAGFGAP